MASTKIQSEQIEDGAITAAKIADGAIVASEVADNAITTAKINADAVTGAKIADNAINSEHYTDGSIDTAHIADDQVTYAKMQHTAAANRVLGATSAGAIGETQIVVGMMAANSVDSDQYVDGSIDTAHIAASQITVAKMAANSVDSDQYVDGSIDTAHIADAQITVGKMAANSVDSDQYVDGSIDTAHIADSQITVGKMAANSVDSAQYVDGSIDTAHYADNSITGAELADNIDIAGTFDVTGATTLDSTLGVAGLTTTEGVVSTRTGDASQFVRRGGNITTGFGDPLYIKHSTTGDMAEDFGVGMTFAVTDSGATQSLGDLGYTRRGADNTADFILQTYNGGTRAEKFRVLAAGGICFNGDKVAANALDDYEEGVYAPTPSISGATGSIAFYANYNRLSYTKIGNQAHINGVLRVESNGVNGGRLNLTLPFTSLNGDEGEGQALFQVQTAAGSGSQASGYFAPVSENSTTLQIQTYTGVTSSNDSAVTMAVNSYLFISGTYTTV